MLKMKIHELKEGSILALCDEELLGKRYKEGETVIDLERYSSFYDGETISEDSDKLEEVIKRAASINAVGKRAIDALDRIGYETKNHKKVEGIPHLQVFVIK